MIMVTKLARKKPVPSTIAAADFKARCLEIMDLVARTGRTIVVTKRGKPVAALSPVPQPRGRLRGSWSERITILGDIVSPIDVVWDAEREADA